MNAITPAAGKPLFALGQIVATPGALDALITGGVTAHDLLHRHTSGDWGDLCADDRLENELAVHRGHRILSSYRLPRTGVKLWVVTEADRSVTTLLLPLEY
jgi:hypothetical protein